MCGSSGGGGGERVLWIAIDALVREKRFRRILVYCFDPIPKPEIVYARYSTGVEFLTVA
jgi:hypothetical protein